MRCVSAVCVCVCVCVCVWVGRVVWCGIKEVSISVYTGVGVHFCVLELGVY